VRVVDADQVSFATEVLERSRTLPVVVDFWAEWCAPCRALGPVLEEAVAARGGEIALVKVDVDTNPGLQMSYGVRGIPAVKAFRDGAVVREFTGAQPRARVDQFLDALLPSPADRLAAAGDEASLRAAIAADAGHVAARCSLGALLLARGARDEAEVVLQPVAHDPAAAGLLARARLADLAAGDGATATALHALASGDRARALEALVELVRSGSGEVRDLARRAAVGLFAELGEADRLTAEYRSRLAAALY